MMSDTPSELFLSLVIFRKFLAKNLIFFCFGETFFLSKDNAAVKKVNELSNE